MPRHTRGPLRRLHARSDDARPRGGLPRIERVRHATACSNVAQWRPKRLATSWSGALALGRMCASPKRRANRQPERRAYTAPSGRRADADHARRIQGATSADNAGVLRHRSASPSVEVDHLRLLSADRPH